MDEYDINFNEIVKMIENRKNNAYRKVNEELIALYWEFGEYISQISSNNEWGTKVIDKLTDFMQKNYPTLKGFNRRGLYRMKQFYETYNEYPTIVSTLLTQLNWSNHVKILSGTKTIEEKEFYIRVAIKENYSARELSRQMKSGYYERYMLSDGKAPYTNDKLINEDEIPSTKFFDTYALEFLNLGDGYSDLVPSVHQVELQ